MDNPQIKTNPFLQIARILCIICICAFSPWESASGQNKLEIRENQIIYNGEPVKLIGLRCSNALISEQATDELIASLDLYKSYGLNTVSVFIMGSRFGDVKGFLPDGTLDPVYRDRLERILRSTDNKGMIMIVGCLYWSTSKAKEELEFWTQSHAETAVYNTASWIREKEFSHVILDPDNEGMAVRDKGWNIEPIIAAAKEAHPELPVANNTKQDPSNEDLNLHFGNKEKGKPYVDSESTPRTFMAKGYWGPYSKETHQSDPAYYNYSRIGRYTIEMKEDQISKTINLIQQYNGILLASTWLQCSPAEGINGPRCDPGGYSDLGSGNDTTAVWNRDIDTLHPDAGILWWMEFVRETYGPWNGSHAGTGTNLSFSE